MPATPHEDYLTAVLQAAIEHAESAPRDAEGNLMPEARAEVEAILAEADNTSGPV